MRASILLVVAVGLALAQGALRFSLDIEDEEPVFYESTWAVSLHEGSDLSWADQGFEVVKKVSFLEDVYLVRHLDTYARHRASRSLQIVPSRDVTASLIAHPNVEWAEQQFLVKYSTRAFSDPLFADQWHLINEGQFGGLAGIDANIKPAWDQGFDGSGVRIAIVDDGLQTTHPDFVRYKADSSYSFNDPEGSDPNPDLTKDFHGTAAGGVAAAANDSTCGVGAAFMAELAGIRLVAEDVTDATTADAIVYKNQLNHIYSNSWGPNDDGIKVGGPRRLTQEALKEGVKKGRGGRGSIFVWAAGNGGLNNDNVNYDGYQTARETISVGAVANTGRKAYYSEPGAALLVVAPSSSSDANAGIRTTDILGANGYSKSDCTDSFTGTSAATPLVSGVIALILQANPDLTWRDVPYVLATTASYVDRTDSDWVTNAGGHHVNHKYGFGLVDAAAAVEAARTHQNLGPEVQINHPEKDVDQKIPDNSTAGVTSSVSISKRVKIEKVRVTVEIDHATSGDLQIVLTSPSGTTSVLSTPHGTISAINTTNGAVSAQKATFGGEIPYIHNLPGAVMRFSLVTCNLTTSCPDLARKIAYITIYGSCRFTDLARVAQQCGAIALIVASTDSDEPNEIMTMGGDDPSITIPCLSISYNAAQAMPPNRQEVVLFHSQRAANNYKDGWTFATTRLLDEFSNGTWTLQVSDMIPKTSGKFKSFKIDIYGTDDGSSGSSGSRLLVSFSFLAICLMSFVLA